MLRPTMAQRLKRGLVGYWSLANASAVDLNAALYGPTVPGVLTNNATVTRADGPSNNLRDAAAFASASSQYLSAADSNILSLGGKGSFSGVVWVYLATTGADQSIVAHYETTGDQRGWWLLDNNAGSRFTFRTSATGSSTVIDANENTLGDPQAETWYMLYFYFDASRGRAGIAANLNARTEAAQTAVHNSTGAFTIGARGSGADFLNGRVAHLGLWNRLLTDQEHFWLYNSGVGRDLTRGC